MASRIYVVTGSNKGIGLAAVRALCKKVEENDVVYLTARSIERGTEAVKQLESEGLKPKFHQLDVDDKSSIKTFADYLKTEHGGLDVLVNNAAIAYKQAATEPFGEQATNTIRVNYFGLQDVCNAMFPILRPHARVMNVSSCVGWLQRIPGEELKKKLSSNSLTEPQLDELMRDFVKSALDGNHETEGWPNSTYSVSKVGVSALSRIQQKKFLTDPREDIIVNYCHPGYVITDMTSQKGVLTVEQGCKALVFGATIPKNAKSPAGEYIWHDTQVVDWVNGPLPAPGY